MRTNRIGWPVAVLSLALGATACGSGETPSDVAAGPIIVAGPRPAAMCELPESVVLVAYELETGEYRWHRCDTGVTYGLVAATDDAVYVTDYESGARTAVEFDAATGEIDGTTELAEAIDQLPDDAALPVATPPDLPGLTIEGGQDDPLVVSDSATGEQRWSVPDNLVYDDVWAIDDQAVYMAHPAQSADAPFTWTVRAYDLRTGAVRWEVDPGGGSYPWWVGDGRVFALWTDLTVLAASTGEVLWATDYQTSGFPAMRGALANDDTVFVTFAYQPGGGD